MEIPRECFFKTVTDQAAGEVERPGYVVRVTDVLGPSGAPTVIVEDADSGQWYSVAATKVRWTEPTKPQVERAIKQHREAQAAAQAQAQQQPHGSPPAILVPGMLPPGAMRPPGQG